MRLKKNLQIKIIGILNGKFSKDGILAKAFDFCTEAAGPDNLLSDEEVFSHLTYQLRTARLSLSIEKSGVKGKWALFPPPRKQERRFEVIAIGASAGGTEAVTTILSGLPSAFPPILIVQHIPDNFTEFFANNLATKVSLKITVVRGGELLEDGTVYIAGNNRHLEIIKNENGKYITKCTDSDKVSGHRPSVDVLFSSVARSAGASAIGVILTGMGCDGAQGLLEMHNAGAYTIGQDKVSCAVYGMPMAAYSLGAVSKQLELNLIARALISAVSHHTGEETDYE